MPLTFCFNMDKLMKENSKITVLVLTFFFLSGFCGLLYEITWTQLISLILGNSIYTIVAVLSSIMGGLAIGGYIGGKIVNNHYNPFRFYGILEGLLGLYALIFPILLRSTIPILQYVYQNADISETAMTVARFLVCFGILIIPAIFMGAMLPALSELLIYKFDHLSNILGKIYGLNLLGSMVGSLITGFYLVPAWGINKTIYLAVFIEFIICIWIFLLPKDIIEPVYPIEEQKFLPRRHLSQNFSWIILLFMALSGFFLIPQVRLVVTDYDQFYSACLSAAS